MLLHNFLRSLVPAHFGQVRRRKSLFSKHQSEVLERKTLLTGNVQVQLIGIDAVLTGDAENNSVEIVSEGTSLIVRGLNNTTINGATTPFTLSASSTRFSGMITASLGAGNDVLRLGTDVSVGGTVSINGGTGNDSIGVTHSTLSAGLFVDGGAGTDSISLQNSTVASSVSLTSSEVAVINVSNSTIGQGLRISTGAGNDDVVLSSTTVDGAVFIHTDGGDDDIVLRNSTLESTLFVNAGKGADVMFIDSTSISRNVTLWMMRGDDNVQIQGTSHLEGRVLVGALLGKDHLEMASTSSVSRITRLGKRRDGVSDALIASRINDAATGAIAKAAAVVSQFNPALTVSAEADSIVENAGTQLTITRTGSTTAALTVTLTSSSPNRATIQATATILAGQRSVTVPITGVDNSTADPDAVVTFTAVADGFNAGTDTVTVTGQEVAALTVEPPTSTPAATIAENAGEPARTFTVRRNTSDNSQSLTVNLTSDRTARLTLPATVVIPAGQASVTFAATVDNNVVDGNVQVLVTAAATGFTSGQSTVTVNDNDTATVTVTPATASVGESVTAGVKMKVVRNTSDNTQALTVSLASSSTRLTVPASVIIPAGQTEVEFDAIPVGNTIADGNIAVTITPTAVNFANVTSIVTVNDDDTATLSITPANPSFAEDATAETRTLTITRNNANLTQPLTVNLSLASTARMSVPPSVQIAANQASATFVVTTVDNDAVDGDASTQLTASTATGTGFANVQTTLTVTDNDTARLSLTPSTGSITEGATSPRQITVRRNTTDLSQAVTVSLTSGNARLGVPASVTIPVGAATATFDATAPAANEIIDGNIPVLITATAQGFGNGTSTITVNDDDVIALSITPQDNSVTETDGTATFTVSLGKVTGADQTVSLSSRNTSVLTVPAATVVVPAGQSSVTVDMNIISGSVADGTTVVQVAAQVAGGTPVLGSISVTDVDTLSITSNIAGNTFVQSNDTVITKNAQFTVTGTTTIGAAVTVDSDGDGQFDDASTTADGSGNYTINVTLTNNTTNRGANRLFLKSVSGANSGDTAVNVHFAVGSVMRFSTVADGTFDIEMLDAAAPDTVANFKAYEASTRYDNLILQRSDPGFIVQAGGFTLSNGKLDPVVKFDTIDEEFNSANSNLKGTISMALPENDPDGGSSEWFINVDDNAGLDANQHTVFGRIIGTGLNVVNAMTTLMPRNISVLYENASLQEVPLRNPPPAGTSLTGTISQTTGSNIFTGTGTLFQTELQVGSSVRIGGKLYFVTNIASNTQMTLDKNAPSTLAGQAAVKDVVPNNADFIVFSNIHEILT